MEDAGIPTLLQPEVKAGLLSQRADRGVCVCFREDHVRKKKTARSSGLGRGTWSHWWTGNSIYLFINRELQGCFSTQSCGVCVHVFLNVKQR